MTGPGTVCFLPGCGSNQPKSLNYHFWSGSEPRAPNKTINLDLVFALLRYYVIKQTMKIVSIIPLFTASVLLVSCGPTGAQKQYQRDSKITQQSMEALKFCMDSIAQSGQYDRLEKYMPIASTRASVLQLANSSHISQQDIPLLASYEHNAGLCERNFESNMDSVDPEIGSIAEQGHQIQESNDAALIDGKENWGQFVERRQNISLGTYQDIVKIANRDTNELNAENQLELEERQQALENMSRSIQNQEIINQENRPIITNCNHFLNTTSCVSN